MREAILKIIENERTDFTKVSILETIAFYSHQEETRRICREECRRIYINTNERLIKQQNSLMEAGQKRKEETDLLRKENSEENLDAFDYSTGMRL